MEQICAIVDAQGFTLRQGFFVRELAVWNGDVRECIEIDPEISMFGLNKKDRRTVQYTTRNIHGLSHEAVDDEAYKQKDLNTILSMMYMLLSRPETPYFGINNPQLGKILDQLNIPYYDLCTLDIVYKRGGFCINHTELPTLGRENLRCALRKTESLWVSLKVAIARAI